MGDGAGAHHGSCHLSMRLNGGSRYSCAIFSPDTVGRRGVRYRTDLTSGLMNTLVLDKLERRT